MKSTTHILFLITAFFITLSSCDNEDEIKAPGTFTIAFDNKIGEENLSLRAAGDQTYDFTDANGQQYNISKLGYYISGIKFFGPEGNGYADPNKITADAAKLTGFYQVLESDPGSQAIHISDVTANSYNRIEFTIGVKSYTVIETTPGGILDPANGAWFLDMDAGYVNLGIEGNGSNSGQEYVSSGDEPEILEGTFSLLFSGWKDVVPEAGQEPILVDNTRIIEFNFDEVISVEEGLNPEVNINVDVAEILEGIDFSQTFSVKRPADSRSFSDKFTEAFSLDSVTQ
ncbi:MAG: MbnP family protein [Saprospiraceae bacterium]